MPLQRYTKEHVQKELAKQAQQFKLQLIECLKLTFEATGSCIHIVMKDEEQCAICEKYVPKN